MTRSVGTISCQTITENERSVVSILPIVYRLVGGNFILYAVHNFVFVNLLDNGEVAVASFSRVWV